jgi:hypothetical protein
MAHDAHPARAWPGEENSMTGYLLIESRDPLESGDVPYFYDLAASLSRGGTPVTLFLVQNAVLPARRGAAATGLEAAARSNVKVLADEFSLRERGIALDRLAPHITPASIDVVIDQLVEGRKTLWH